MTGPDTIAGRRHDPLLVAAVAVAVALAVADSSIVVLALGDLYATFDTSIVGVSWTITAYNLAIVVGAFAVLPFEHRVAGHRLAGIGFTVFAAASLLCGLSGSFEILIVGRVIQGLGAALALAGAVPVLVGIRGSDRHAIAVWAGAATLGAALGPALGGFLTELFSWRAIFVIQAPLGALGILAVVDRRVRAVEIPPQREPNPRTWPANLGFFALYGALVGALFLAVLLLVVVWGWSPIAAAILVSALPVGAIAVRRLVVALPTRTAALTGGVGLAGGLVALALVPDTSWWWAALPLAACGVGLGMLGGLLAPAAVPPTEASVTRATTAEVLDSTISIRQKVDVALEFRDLIAELPRGEVPDVAAVFAEVSADDPDVAAASDATTDAIRSTITRAFRSSFVIAAAFAVGAAIVASFMPTGRGVPRRDGPFAACVVISVAVALIVGGAIGAGALDYGTREYVAPCEAPPDPFPQGGGIDGTLQRISLSAINGAACELDTGREELILSLESRSGFGPEVTWTQDTLEDALEAGLVRAIDDADDRDTLPGFVATALRFLAERAPIDWILGRFDIPFLEA